MAQGFARPASYSPESIRVVRGEWARWPGIQPPRPVLRDWYQIWFGVLEFECRFRSSEELRDIWLATIRSRHFGRFKIMKLKVMIICMFMVLCAPVCLAQAPLKKTELTVADR